MRFPEAFDGTFGRLHFGDAPVTDERHRKRLVRLADQLLAHPDGTLPAKLPDPYQLDAAYQLFKAADVTHAAVIHTHTQLTRRRMAAAAGPLLLIAHDDVLLDFSTITSAELGPLGNGYGRGFVCHNSLAVTPAREVLGLAHQVLHCHPPREQRRRRPGPAGRLWRDAVAALPAAPAGKRYVHLADSAADITELLDYADEQGREYVIRSQHNRRCAPAAGAAAAKLHEAARRWGAVGPPRRLAVAAQSGRPHRQAVVRIAWAAVTLAPPPGGRGRGRERGVPLPVWVVRAWEASPPPGCEALDWLLVTNVAVQCAADAWERTEWYGCRMVVEEYHKAQKSGVTVEALQLTTRGRLEAAIGVLSVVAVLLLAVRDAGRQEATASQPAGAYVPLAWLEMLSSWRHGGVRRDWTVGEFLRALGRLGGHQDRPSDGPPGWLTLWRGWAKLQAMLEGAALADKTRSGGT
jgi:hypothetical protein